MDGDRGYSRLWLVGTLLLGLALILLDHF